MQQMILVFKPPVKPFVLTEEDVELNTDQKWEKNDE